LAQEAVVMNEFLSFIFLGIGVIIMVGAIVMILGFAVSMPIGVAAAAKEHHEHPLPPEPKTPHYRQTQMNLRQWRMPTWGDLKHIKLPSRAKF
jgi:hypothetical protein